MSKPVQMWEAVDGSVHKDKKTADFIDLEAKFFAWFEDNMIYGNFQGCKIGPEDFKEWFLENPETISAYLYALKKEISR